MLTIDVANEPSVRCQQASFHVFLVRRADWCFRSAIALLANPHLLGDPGNNTALRGVSLSALVSQKNRVSQMDNFTVLAVHTHSLTHSRTFHSEALRPIVAISGLRLVYA